MFFDQMCAAVDNVPLLANSVGRPEPASLAGLVDGLAR